MKEGRREHGGGGDGGDKGHGGGKVLVVILVMVVVVRVGGSGKGGVPPQRTVKIQVRGLITFMFEKRIPEAQMPDMIRGFAKGFGLTAHNVPSRAFCQEVLREMADGMARIGDDDIAGHLGHVFMLHFRKDGSIAHYQSFIKYFTLKQWLRGDTPHLDSADAEASYIYDAAQVLEFFDELEAVLVEKKWTTMMDRSYAKLFGARGAAGTAVLEHSASSRMHFYCDLACVRG